MALQWSFLMSDIMPDSETFEERFPFPCRLEPVCRHYEKSGKPQCPYRMDCMRYDPDGKIEDQGGFTVGDTGNIPF